MFAVVDVETTGLHPGYQHRVTEISVVLLDEGCRQVDFYETLVNPRRDMGAQDIHGIGAADARLAPGFEEIAGDLRVLLAGNVVVGHNVRFDTTFLDAEFTRAGFPVEDLAGSSLCTLALADYYFDQPTRTLAACCRALGIDYEQAHRASADAIAAAQLLAEFHAADHDAPWWSEAAQRASRVVWPDIRPLRTPPVVRGASARLSSEIDLFVQRVERFVEPPYSPEYFSLLDKVLADGRVSRSEEMQMMEFAHAYGISRGEIQELNVSYVAAIARSFAADQYLSVDERARLVQLVSLLDVKTSDSQLLIDYAETVAEEIEYTAHLSPGDLIVFTGMDELLKAELTLAAESVGLIVHPRTTKKCRLVVAADPESGSRKAQSAQSAGIPVVDVASFEASLRRLRGAGSWPRL